MRERDESRHLAIGAGAPSDPDATDVPDPDAPGPAGSTPAGDADAPADTGPDVPGPAGDADTTTDATRTTADGPSRRNGHSDHDGDDPAVAAPRTADDVVQAVADFLDDLVDDPTFAPNPAPPPPSP